jgi:protein giant-lens (argos)
LNEKQTCEPVKKLPKCRFFRDITWTFINYPDNSTQQIMHCLCPKNSVAYIIKRQAYQSDQGVGYQYSFACSPQSVSHLHNLGLCGTRDHVTLTK